MNRIRRRAAQWLMILRQEADPDPRKLERWLRWIGRDRRRLDAFEEVEILASQLDSWEPSVKKQLLRELTQDLGAPNAKSRQLRSVAWRWALTGCAAAALLTLSFVLWNGDFHPEGTSFARDYSTARGENRTVRLGDGSQITLGARSHLAVTFDAHQRVVRLQSGEAYFQVRHDVQRPFYVFAGKLKIVDLGTEFDVRRDTEQVVVAVGEGVVNIQGDLANIQGDQTPADATFARPPAVALGSSSAPAPAASGLQLHAGEQAVSTAADASPRVGRIDTRAAGSWRNGRFEFQNETLATVVANINRYSSREIEITDPAIAVLRFTGSVYPARLDKWLDAVREVFVVRVEEASSGKVRLSAARGGVSQALTP